MRRRRISLYIDGTNLFAGQYDLFGPKVEIVQKQGLPVHAIFFPNRFSLGLSYGATSSLVLNYRHRFAPNKSTKVFPKSLRIIALKDPACKQTG